MSVSIYRKKFPEQLREGRELWYLARQRARTDILFLCNHILDYPDVCEEVHGPIIANLQKFKGAYLNQVFDATAEEYKRDQLVDILFPDGSVAYEPACAIEELEGPRNNLFLYPRSHLKTTVITQAHTIQWILNYPNIRILLSMATGTQVEAVMRAIKFQFTSNPRFRELFPEYCPSAKKSAEWGTSEMFTVPCRIKGHREPTVSTCSTGKVVTGMHYEVIKCSDMVVPQNICTQKQIEDVKDHFGYLDPLVERFKGGAAGWKDVEGTIYAFGDLHDTLSQKDGWAKVVRGATIVPGTTAEGGRTLDMKRFPPEQLLKIRTTEMTPDQYSSQYELVPLAASSMLCQKDDIIFLPKQVIGSLAGRIHCTIDLATMGGTVKGRDTDFTVLNVHKFDKAGRLYIMELHRGRFNANEVINLIFSIYNRWRPNDFKVERGALIDGIMPALVRERERRQTWPQIVLVSRSSLLSKQDRIRGLQSWLANKNMRFADDVDKVALFQEVLRFPSPAAHDDILDTCADALLNADGEPINDVLPEMAQDPFSSFGTSKKQPRFTGFSEGGEPTWDGTPEPFVSGKRTMAGVL